MTGPLVTVAFPCYEQEAYVAKALRSLMAQTYSPLEIVISDDASGDGTFQIVRRLVDQYNGRHQIVCHQNAVRKGIENYNQLMDMSRGEFVVMAHSDDVSMPQRVERIVTEWLGRNVSMVSSNAVVIDSADKVLGLLTDPSKQFDLDTERLATQGWCPAIFGSVLAWHRQVFDVFGPLDRARSAISTDWILPFRASLLNGIHYISQPLMYRREHADSRAAKYLIHHDDRSARAESDMANSVSQFLYMLDTTQNLLRQPGADVERLSQISRWLTQSILNRSLAWSKVRNEMLAEKRRCVWTEPG